VSTAVASPHSLSWQLSPGRSETFRRLQAAVRKILHDQDKSIVLGWRQELRNRLAEIIDEAREENWDGYGAARLSDVAVSAAHYFIDLLPKTEPLPTVIPSPNGEIAFEWDIGTSGVFTVMTHKGMIVYAGLLGPDRKQHGQEPLGDELPRSIRTILETYFAR